MDNQHKIIVHDYKGFGIPQRKTDGYVNLTNMARATNKKVNDWLRLIGTKDYVEEVSRSTGIPADQLTTKEWDNNYKCTTTWGHKLIAISFAKWISPSFAVWCNQHLLELMETGLTKLEDEVVELQKDTDDFWFFLEKVMELKPMLNKDIDLAKQMLKNLYENY